ncbi:hypothetical protein M2T79_09490 [Elizabethkingia miricola]|uniref:DUF6808 domain-containing protein n=1 Tax=Elizabethkingia miricola TaxID=172045 RepID=UPI0020190D3A|nr:hypothetical protein [Elizabethkingia miricola]MCL1656830.1 hypothetical protein [Elizabethkingia miricola]
MKKNALITILCLIIIALIANLLGGWFSLSQKDRIVKESLKTKVDTVVLEKYISKVDSSTHGQFKEKQGEIIKNYITNKYMTYVQDTLAPALNIASSKIDELTRTNMLLEGKLKATRYELDENKKARIYYENKYIQIVSNSDSTINYKYNAIIDIAKFNKRSWILGKEHTYVDISSPDPNFKINGVEHFKKRIDVKPKRWGIGIQGGYYYVPTFNQFYPAFGIGLSYNLIRF